jgi:hypothetical protein
MAIAARMVRKAIGDWRILEDLVRWFGGSRRRSTPL